MIRLYVTQKTPYCGFDGTAMSLDTGNSIIRSEEVVVRCLKGLIVAPRNDLGLWEVFIVISGTKIVDFIGFFCLKGMVWDIISSRGRLLKEDGSFMKRAPTLHKAPNRSATGIVSAIATKDWGIPLFYGDGVEWKGIT